MAGESFGRSRPRPTPPSNPLIDLLNKQLEAEIEAGIAKLSRDDRRKYERLLREQGIG